MVNIPTRMRKLNTLLAVRLGPGAAVLPKSVTRLHLEFSERINGGHRGARKFWRVCLPRLAYHNPAVPMTVKRHTSPEGPSELCVHLNLSHDDTSPQEASSRDAAKEKAAGTSVVEEVRKIDMRMKQDQDILQELMDLTGAKQVEPTPEEVELMRDLEEQRVKSEQDSVLGKAQRAQEKKQKQMLEQARQGVM